MCNRCKAAVTRLGAVMESCRCDGSSRHPGAVRQMEPQSHPLTSHPAGIRGRVKLGKSRMRHFQETWSIWKTWVSVLSEHHWQENERRGKSCYISSYKWFRMLEFTFFYYSFFFVLSWKFENSSVHIYSGNKGGWWRESLKIQKLNVVKYTKSILGQPPVQWSSGETPSHPSQPFNAFCWKSKPVAAISKAELPNRWVKHAPRLPKYGVWSSNDLIDVVRIATELR